MANPIRAGHTTYPEFADGGAPLGSSGCPVESPIPRSKHRPFVSRGYDRENQRNIMRAIDGTGTRTDEVPDTVYDVLATGGQALDNTIQRALEDRMDADFSDVRIHTGPKAAKAADAIDARAFTCGNSIAFNSGEYEPESPEGQYLLAHELAHVKQQTGGANGVSAAGVASGRNAVTTREPGAAISMMPQADADLEIDPDPQLEREANQAAEEALSGEEPLIVNRLGADVHIQRSPQGVTASNAKNIRELSDELRDLRETVEQHDTILEAHDETIDEVDTARENLAESLEGDLETVEAATEQSTGGKFVKGGGKGLLKRVAAGGAGVATLVGLGAADPTALTDVLPALVSSVVGATTDGADAALSQAGGATPEAVAEAVMPKLAQSQEFAEEIANDDSLAAKLASNDQFLEKISQKVAGMTGGDNVVGEGGQV